MKTHAAGLRDGDRLAAVDFDEHNAEVRELWAAFKTGGAPRVPVIVGTNTRYFMFNDAANPARIQFKDYLDDPDTMFDTILQFQRWSRFNILQDTELGLPEVWEIGVDLQNFYDAAFFGCELEYIEGQVPDTTPRFASEPVQLLEQGRPDPFGGTMSKALQFYEHFRRRADKEVFCGRPIRVNPPCTGTDGPFTVACNLCSPETICLMMMEEPEFFAELMEFITGAIIHRMKAWRALAGWKFPHDGFGLADDSIALLSLEMYREQVLPFDKQFYDTFATDLERGIHLCGDATRHFRLIRDELKVGGFDTGFPVDFGKLRRDLGPDVRIQGGPHVNQMLKGSPDSIRAEVKRIIDTGVADGGRFVLREGNNLAPYTPLENTEAMFQAGRDFGRLRWC